MMIRSMIIEPKTSEIHPGYEYHPTLDIPLGSRDLGAISKSSYQGCEIEKRGQVLTFEAM